MTSWRDRLNRMTGKSRFVVSRIFIHLAGQEVAPLLGVLNRTAQAAIEAEGELQVVGEGLVDVCNSLLDYETYWQSAANEGDIFGDEGDAGDYVTELFTDSAQRYGTSLDLVDPNAPSDAFSVPITQNVVVMLTVAAEGTVPELETNLADIQALRVGLKTLINLHYSDRLRAVQVHFSPAQLGDELTQEQLVLNFAELVPL